MMKIKHFFLPFVILNLVSIYNVSFAANGSPFSDVPADHPNFAAIVELKNRNIIGGYADKTFKPNQTVNRVEALKMILLGSGVNVPDKKGAGGFSDTGKNEWYAKYLLHGLALKIVQGYEDKTFQPTRVVNLVENLKFLLLANNVDLSKTEVTQDPYDDAPKDRWYGKYLQYAKDNKLIDAYADNNIRPAQGMTRGKLAEMMHRLIKLKDAAKAGPKTDMSEMGAATPIAEVYDPKKEPTGPVNPGSSGGGGGGSSAKQEPIFLGVKIEGFAFNVNSMTIGIGTSVKWMNKDSAPHTVTSDNAKFDSGTLNNGQTWEYTFKEAGTYEYHCGIHPNMKGIIIVKPANEVPTI